MDQHVVIRRPEESLSAFEQYLSGSIDITEQQFQILMKYNIEFSQTIQPPPPGKIKVPVRVTKLFKLIDEQKGIGHQLRTDAQKLESTSIINAGYLIGKQEEIVTAFTMLGIHSPLTVTSGVRQFGYDLFSNLPSAFEPVTNAPVGPEYVLGPGDELRITVWGKVEGNWNVIIDRSGNISLPKVGIIGVSGLTFGEFKEVLHKELSKYYTGFNMNVSMGSLKTMVVYVVGNASNPGAYTVSSLSTLINALFVAGGPSKNGTLRDIQVRRNGQTVVHFDMYDLLLKGDKTNDIRLMPEDVIFIPSSGNLAVIAGSIRNPAIYELKGETTVSDLIDMAGGLNDVAFKGRVQIMRIIDSSRQTIFEANLRDIENNDIRLQSGDILKIFQIVQDRQVVRLTGAVNNSGEYGFTSGMTVKDLISMAGGLGRHAYTKEAELTRVHLTNEGPETEKITINLERALSGDPDYNIALEENDYLFVRTIPDYTLYKTVSIGGEVRFPGTYTIKKDETLSSLIRRAGGYTEDAYLRGAVFKRESIKTLQQTQIDEMVARLERDLLSAGAVETSAATSQDEARIKELELKQKRDFIEKLKLIRAQGRMVIVLSQIEQLKQSRYDIKLEDNDALFIPDNPQSVQVIGAVFNQTAYIFDRDKSVPGYIRLAGGYKDSADKDKTYLLKVDGTAVSPGGGLSRIAWDSNANRWEIGLRDLEPGDTIVVPEKLERIAWMRNIKDITQILYQIATAAGVIIVAF